MIHEEGVVKFHAVTLPESPPTGEAIEELLLWRNRLYDAGLIGLYPDGIGYGNASVRCEHGFVITGTQTGGIQTLTSQHLTEVVSVDIAKNSLVCRGPVAASSESLTHAAIYGCDAAIAAVVHVHHAALWERLRGLAPTTDAAVPYGTRAMAREVERLACSELAGRAGILVMGGHRDGLVAFGGSVAEASNRLLGELAAGTGR